MAVSVGFYSIVVRKSTIEARFHGGVKSYAAACPNASLCMDDKIVRVGFMAFDDANAYRDWLRSFGFVASGDATTSEIAVIRQDKGHLAPCAWLELGHIDEHPIAWLAGTDPGPASIPDADMRQEIIRSPLSPEEVRERYELISRDERGVDTYREKVTGELFYLGRTTTSVRSPGWWRQIWRRLTTR